MIIAIPKDRRQGETRVAATPENGQKTQRPRPGRRCRKRRRRGDADYRFRLRGDGREKSRPMRPARSKTPISFSKCARPAQDEIALYKRGAILAALLSPATEKDTIKKLAEAGINAFAMEFCRAYRARKRWMCCPAKQTSPVTKPWLMRRLCLDAPCR